MPATDTALAVALDELALLLSRGETGAMVTEAAERASTIARILRKELDGEALDRSAEARCALLDRVLCVLAAVERIAERRQLH